MVRQKDISNSNAASEGVDLLASAAGTRALSESGIVTAAGGAPDAFSKKLIEAVGQHRHWERTV